MSVSLVLPLDPSILCIKATHDFRQVGVHEFNNLLQVILTTAKICLANRRLALPTSATSHLPQHCWTN